MTPGPSMPVNSSTLPCDLTKKFTFFNGLQLWHLDS